MRRLVLVSVAIVMGLLLAVSLLTTGISVPGISTNHTSIAHAAVVTTMPRAANQTLVATKDQPVTQNLSFDHARWGGWGWGWGGWGGWGGCGCW